MLPSDARVHGDDGAVDGADVVAVVCVHRCEALPAEAAPARPYHSSHLLCSVVLHEATNALSLLLLSPQLCI